MSLSVQAMKQYGILDGVFTPKELVSENLKEKDDKMAFLQKLINHVGKSSVNKPKLYDPVVINALETSSSAAAESGQDLQGIRPSKIVAGSETEKTNELLVALATILEKAGKQNGKPAAASNNKMSNGDHHNNAVKTSNGVPEKQIKPVVKRSTESIVQKESTKSVKPANEVYKPVKPIHKESTGSNKAAANSKPSTKTTPAKSSTKSDSKPSKPADSRGTPSKEAPKASRTKQPPTELIPTKPKSPKTPAVPAEIIPVPPEESIRSIEEEEPVKDVSSKTTVRPSSTAQLSPELASSDSGITLEHPLSATLNVKIIIKKRNCYCKSICLIDLLW